MHTPDKPLTPIDALIGVASIPYKLKAVATFYGAAITTGMSLGISQYQYHCWPTAA